MQKITPFLWFDGTAEEAAKFYVSIFKNAKILESNPMATMFELEGTTFTALNGGPEFKFNEAISFLISCKDQEEVDYYWNKLTADGGSEGNCGWCKDKYGVSWQVVPTILSEMLRNPDPEKAKYAMNAMLSMNKIVIKDLSASE